MCVCDLCLLHAFACVVLLCAFCVVWFGDCDVFYVDSVCNFQLCVRVVLFVGC